MNGRCGILEERGESDISKVEMHLYNLCCSFPVGHSSSSFAPTDRVLEEASYCDLGSRG